MCGFFKQTQAMKIACLLDLAKTLCSVELLDLIQRCQKVREADTMMIGHLKTYTAYTSLTSYDAIQLYLSMGTNMLR